jgi:hypothetical protein
VIKGNKHLPLSAKGQGKVIMIKMRKIRSPQNQEQKTSGIETNVQIKVS